MKKLACLLLALLLCLTFVAALAESTPSKTTADLTRVEVTAENLPADSGFFIRIVNEDETEYQKRLDICKAEVSKLAAAGSAEAYFGKDVDLKALVAADQLNVFEFKPVIAGGYNAAYSKVTATMLFSTPCEAGQKVAVLIGLVTENTDGSTIVDWKAIEGIGVAAEQVEAAGSIQVDLNAETVLAIQNGIALLAIVSDWG